MKTFSYKRLWRFYPFYLELIPITAIIFGLLHVWISYPGLPEQIPVALTMSGSITAYDSKSLARLLYAPLTALILYLLLTFISYRRMANMENKQGDLQFPSHIQKKVAKSFLNSFRSFSVQMIFAAITFLVLATVLSSYLTIQAAYAMPNIFLLALPWVFYILATVCAMLQFFRTRKMRKIIQGL